MVLLQCRVWNCVRVQLLAGPKLPGSGSSSTAVLRPFHCPAVFRDLRGQHPKQHGGEAQVPFVDLWDRVLERRSTNMPTAYLKLVKLAFKHLSNYIYLIAN